MRLRKKNIVCANALFLYKNLCYYGYKKSARGSFITEREELFMKKKVCCLVAVLALVAVVSTGASAARNYSYSNVTYIRQIASMANATSSAHGYTLHTRPSSGKAGVRVSVYGSDGSFLGSKNFSYYTDSGKLNVSVKSGQVAVVYINSCDNVTPETGVLTMK